MDDILKLIEEEKKNLSEQLENSDDKAAAFYKDFKSKYYCSNIYDICEIPVVDLATVLVMADEPDLDFDEVYKAMKGAERFLEISDNIVESIAVTEFLNILLRTDQYQKVKDLFSNKDKKNIFEWVKGEYIYIGGFENCLAHNKIKKENFVGFMELYEKMPDKLSLIHSLLGALKKIKIEKLIHNHNINVYGELYHVNVREKDKSRYVNRKVLSRWNVNEMMDTVRNALNYGQKVISAEAAVKKSLTKKIALYDELREKLISYENGELRNILEFVRKIPDDKIRLEVLKYVYMHDMEKHRKLQDTYDYLSANDVTHYRVLLSKFGIDKKSYDVSTIMNNSLSDVEEILNILRNIDINESEILIRILQNTNLSVVKEIYSFYQSGIITVAFIKKHPELFDDKNILNNCLKQNINYLINEGINVKFFKKNCEVLLLDSVLFESNFNILKQYNLISCMKSSVNYSFLGSNLLCTAIDTLLELGYENLLESDLSILNYQDRFVRLRLLKELNIPIENKKDLIEVLTTDKFYMPDEMIESYLYNACTYNIPNVSLGNSCGNNLELDKFLDGLRVYNFDGVLISKNKVDRNSKLVDSSVSLDDMRMFSILEGSILNDDEISKIVSCLSNNKNSQIVKKVD